MHQQKNLIILIKHRYSDIVKLNHILVLREDILKKQSQVYFTLIEKKWNSEYGSIYINLELWNLGFKFQQFILKTMLVSETDSPSLKIPRITNFCSISAWYCLW